MANSPTAEPTPNAHRLGGFAVCKPASIRSSFMSRKQSQPSRHHHWTKIHHQQCRNSQERPERELILAGDFPTQGIHTAQPATAGALGQVSLPPRDVEDNNHGDPHQCSQQSPQQDRQERPAHAKEGSHHHNHLNVPHPHASVPPHHLIQSPHNPNQQTPQPHPQ